MDNESRKWAVPVGVLIGGGLMFGLAKGFNARTGFIIALTIVGAGAGAAVGYVASAT